MEKRANIKIDYKKQAYDFDGGRSLFVAYAPLNKRTDLYKLIAINGEIASIREKVSEAAQGLTRLQFWLMQLENIYHNKEELYSPEALSLKNLIESYDLSFADMQSWLLIRQKDYEAMPLSTWADWQNYMAKTGGLTAKFWLQIIDENASAAQQDKVQKIGALWAAVGCLRAVSFHRYIRLNLWPKELLFAQGMLVHDGWQPSPKDDLSPVVEKMVQNLQQDIADLPSISIHKSLRLQLVYIKGILAHFEKCGYNPMYEKWMHIPKKTYWNIFIRSLGTGRA